MSKSRPRMDAPKVRAILLALTAVAAIAALSGYHSRSHVPAAENSAPPSSDSSTNAKTTPPSLPVPPSPALEPNDSLRIINPNLLDLQLLPDGKTVIVVGTEGTLLRSEDDGLSYVPIPSGTREYLAKLLIDQGTGAVLAVGSGGVVLRSEDQGRTFSRVGLEETRVISGIAQSPATQGIVFVGDGGFAYYSADGGLHFSAETTGSTAYLTELVALAGPRARFVAAGDQGTLLVRERSGQWHGTQAAGDKFVTALVALRAGTVLAGLQDGRILRSDDEGDHWSETHVEKPDHYVYAFDTAPTADLVLARSRKEPFLLSSDGGRHFDKLTFGGNSGNAALTWLNGSGFVGLAANGSVLRSDASARKWLTSIAKQPARASKVVRNARTQTLLAAGGSGYLSRSTDGGKSFDVVHEDLGSLIRAVAWDSKTDTLIGVGLDATVVRSTDGGRSYRRQRISLARGNELSALTFEPHRSSFVAGTTEGVLYRSTDGGRSFSEQTTVAKPVLQLLALGEERILSIGSEAGLLISTDSGNHFRGLSGTTNTVLRRVERAGQSAVVVAVGEAGAIFRSEDVGEHFERMVTPGDVPTTLRGLWFQPQSQRVWVVGDRGTLLVSDPLGKNFRRVPVPTEENLFVVGGSSDGKLLYVGGNAGLLLRSLDYGQSFEPLPTGSTQPVRVIATDPTTDELFIAGVGGLLMRSGGQPTPKRIPGRFEGRFDHAFYHEPSRTMLLLGDRLIRFTHP